MKILAFLQNQWVKDPARVQAIYDRHGDDPDRRAKLNARFLFYRSLTGRRLRAAFGELCDEIVWEEASLRKAGKSSGVFPADENHMAECVRHHKPDVVLTFGKVASAALAVVFGTVEVDGKMVDFTILHGPHPAARQDGVMWSLRSMAGAVRRLKEREASNA
jgi:hypothetical protein